MVMSLDWTTVSFGGGKKVPLDGAIFVVDDVGCDPDGVLLELRKRRKKRQNGK